jgi:hypothetical protein
MRRLIALFLALPLLVWAADPASPFRPNSAGTVTVAATTTSGSTRVALVGGGPNISIANAGTSTAFCEFGPSTVTAATATGFPFPSGVVYVAGRALDVTHVACITSTGTATVYVTTGEGS